MINTIIAEDNKYIQKHFADLIASDERFHLTDIVADAFEAEKLCYKGIDLVLMDVLTLHRHSGLTAGRRIKEKWPKTKVIIMTSLIDPDILAKAKAGCADSLWYKDHSNKELLEVIERTLAGERVFPDCSPVIEMENMFSDEISPAQLEILRCYIRGMTYAEIGEKFGITSDGVRYHIREMVKKGGFKNKEELIATAIDSKLIVTTLKDE